MNIDSTDQISPFNSAMMEMDIDSDRNVLVANQSLSFLWIFIWYKLYDFKYSRLRKNEYLLKNEI